MSKITHTGFVLLLLLFLGSSTGNYAAQSKQKTSNAPTGTLQKMIVENGSVAMDLDLDRLNGISSVTGRPATLHFAAGANSFFTILVFNDLLRGPEPGSITLIPQTTGPAGVNPPGYNRLPLRLVASLKQLVIEKLLSDAASDLAVRDSKTGFTFFNIEGHHYDYDANAQLLSITGGNLRVSKELANALGRPAEANARAGKISISAVMRTDRDRRYC
jgi:hypothetical protein